MANKPPECTYGHCATPQTCCFCERAVATHEVHIAEHPLIEHVMCAACTTHTANIPEMSVSYERIGA